MNQRDLDVLAELEKFSKQAAEMLIYREKRSALFAGLFEPFRRRLKTFLEENNINVSATGFVGEGNPGAPADPKGLADNLENFISKVKSGRWNLYKP